MHDWRESGEKNVQHALGEVNDGLGEVMTKVGEEAENVRNVVLAPQPEYDRAEAREAVLSLKATLIESGHSMFDIADEVAKLTSGSALKNLEGKEPTGYSKRDGGVAHDAVYGAASQKRVFARTVSWPLNLKEWEKTRAKRGRNGPGEVTASGVKKYEKTVADQKVTVVVGQRPPPI